MGVFVPETSRGGFSFREEAQKQVNGEFGTLPSGRPSKQISQDQLGPDDLSREVFGVMGLPLDSLN